MHNSPKPHTTAGADLNPCDAPFGEPFSAYLERQEQHERHLATTRPLAELEPNARPVAPGDYTTKITAQNHGHNVHLIVKQHGGDWHTPEQILESLGIPYPYGLREFTPIAKAEATLKVHTS